MKSVRCGAFRAQKVGTFMWEITCNHLPDWRQTVVATEPDVMTVLLALQAEYRDTWV